MASHPETPIAFGGRKSRRKSLELPGYPAANQLVQCGYLSISTQIVPTRCQTGLSKSDEKWHFWWQEIGWKKSYHPYHKGGKTPIHRDSYCAIAGDKLKLSTRSW